MELGFTIMNTPDEPPIDELARAVEDRGFDSLWIGEHSHIPAIRTTPYPGGGPLPSHYTQMMDPFLALTAAAAATDRLVLATGVALPLEHDIFQLAKKVTTLDRLSGGRFVFGVGAGWNVEELADHRPDIPWAQRYRAMGEAIGALRALWTEDEATYHGRWFDFDGAITFPKPTQRPHPPVYCGAGGRVGMRETIEWADGWLPVDMALGDVAKRVTRFREKLADAGRQPIPITLTTMGDPTLETLEGYVELGIERVVVGAGREGWTDASTTYPFMDRYAAMIPSFSTK